MTIAIAIMDYPSSRRLFLTEDSPADLLEVHGPQALSVTSRVNRRRLLLHNAAYNTSLADDSLMYEHEFLRTTRELLRLTESMWISLHLGFSAQQIEFRNDRVYPTTPILSRHSTLNLICRNLDALRSGLEVPILLENMDYSPTGAYEHICEPSFISEVLSRVDGSLLLDLAHARISAEALDMPTMTYVTRLPLDRVRQFHCNSPRSVSGLLHDTHDPMTRDDFAFLQELLQLCSPDVITLEYRAESSIIRRHLRKLTSML